MQRAARSTLTLVALVALLAACGEEVEVGSESGENNAANNANNTAQNNSVNNASNNANNASNNASNNANNNAGCADDAACGAGSICEGGACVAGCRDTAGCEGARVCHEGRCVECIGDADCSHETVCEADACVSGCRDDAGCDEGRICEGGACGEGCRDDAGCEAGSICEGLACVSGCRSDAACEDGQICEGTSCVAGCRDDAGCEAGSICEGTSCVAGCRDDVGCSDAALCREGVCTPRGVACRVDADCNVGDRCAQESALCEANPDTCAPDGAEPNDGAPGALVVGTTPNLSICPGDTDLFAVTLAEGETLEIAASFSGATGQLELDLLRGAGIVAMGAPTADGAALTWAASLSGEVVLRVVGDSPQARVAYGLSVVIVPSSVCGSVEVTLYSDADMDGFGDASTGTAVCLVGGEPPAEYEGWVAMGEDCAPVDGSRNPDADEVCSDWVDDDCDNVDSACPTSQPGVMVPTWSCEDAAPPGQVYAWARFDEGDGYFQSGGCFVFFEGLPGEFYVKSTLRRTSTDSSCTTINGCTCPSLNGWPSYDRRLYAFTLAGEADACPDITLIDHGGERQPVSNECRKYLYQLHYPGREIPWSFIASTQEALERRLAAFPTVEIACAEDAPHRNLPYQTLRTAAIQRNAGFTPMR